MKEKSPFVTYTTEEILASEAMLYTIQVGKNVFDSNGQHFFNQKTATTHYNRILRDLLERIYMGTGKEQKQAVEVLPYLRIVPLRIH